MSAENRNKIREWRVAREERYPELRELPVLFDVVARACRPLDQVPFGQELAEGRQRLRREPRRVVFLLAIWGQVQGPPAQACRHGEGATMGRFALPDAGSEGDAQIQERERARPFLAW